MVSIEKILISNIEFLNSTGSIVTNSKFKKSKIVYSLSKELQLVVSEARNQIKQGHFYSNEDVEKEAERWIESASKNSLRSVLRPHRTTK